MSNLSALNHNIIEFFEKLSSWENDVVREKGLTPPQMHTLEILGINKSMRMKEVAERMGITTGTLTVMIDRLVEKEYVTRKPHESDRRSIMVELTPSGLKMFKEHDRLHLRLVEDLTVNFTDQEREILLSCFKKMNTHF